MELIIPKPQINIIYDEKDPKYWYSALKDILVKHREQLQK